MRSSHSSNIRNSRSPHRASSFSNKNTAATFSSSTLPQNRSSATLTRKSKSCCFKISRRQPRTARRNAAVYHPCDWISSLKNHCTPAACSAEPPSLSARRISAATLDGDPLIGASVLEPIDRATRTILFCLDRLLDPYDPVIYPQQQRCDQPNGDHGPPYQLGPMHFFAEVVHEPSAEWAGNKRSYPQRQKCKSHIRSLLPSWSQS